MTIDEIDALINYLDRLGPGDMRDGTYTVQLTHTELQFITEALEEYKIG